MKVFLGILVFTSMALALVDESAALNATPESKKTDLLISTGNGQTIKISTDGKKPIVSQFNRSAQRFRMNKQFIRRVNFRKGQDEDPTQGGDEGNNFGNTGSTDEYGHGDEGNNDHGDYGQGSESNDEGDIESELDELNSVIGSLSHIRNDNSKHNPNDDTYSVPTELIDQILEILEDYEAVLTEGGDDSHGGDDSQGGEGGYNSGEEHYGDGQGAEPNPEEQESFNNYNDEFRARRRARAQSIAKAFRHSRNNKQWFHRNNRLRNGPVRFVHP